MRRPHIIIAMTLCSLSLPATAAAQFGYITVYADGGGMVCSLDDDKTNVRTLFIYHEGSASALALRFQLEASSGFTGTFIEQRSAFFTKGAANTGVNIDYPECTAAPILAMEVDYMFAATSDPCSELKVVAHRLSTLGAPEIIDCSIDAQAAVGRPLVVNAGSGCAPWCSTTSVSPETWSRIKAFYQ